ncbi:hypothetical protein PVAND_017757, partial [Polypedilum vanderplanki]
LKAGGPSYESFSSTSPCPNSNILEEIIFDYKKSLNFLQEKTIQNLKTYAATHDRKNDENFVDFILNISDNYETAVQGLYEDIKDQVNELYPDNLAEICNIQIQLDEIENTNYAAFYVIKDFVSRLIT